MGFIEKFLGTITHDKKLHFFAGFIVGLTSIFSLLFALIMLQLVAIGKEYYDYLNPDNHTVDFNDYTATVAGGIVSIMIILLLV